MEQLPTVCFFQAYNRDYIRAESLLAGLRANGVPVVRCQVNRPGPLRYPRALTRFLRAVRRCDVVLANFRSFELLWLLRLLTRKPILYDAYISFWQSACEERRWFAPDSLIGRALHGADRFNCAIADHVLMDTEAHREYFAREFRVRREKLTSVYISCEEELFRPRPAPVRGAGPVVAFWSGSGIPLQGLDVLYEAMRRLRERGTPVVLRLAGSSPILRAFERRARAEGLLNIVFLGQIPRADVVEEIARAHFGLGGHYSTLPKAGNVIAGKVFELMAMRKAVVVGDGPAPREIFVHGENGLLCERGSPGSLAAAIERLVSDPALCERLAAAAFALYRSRLRPAVNVLPLLPVLRRLASPP